MAIGTFLWDETKWDQWSEITRIPMHQIHSEQGLTGSFDAQWWSRITDATSDHPKGRTLISFCWQGFFFNFCRKKAISYSIHHHQYFVVKFSEKEMRVKRWQYQSFWRQYTVLLKTRMLLDARVVDCNNKPNDFIDGSSNTSRGLLGAIFAWYVPLVSQNPYPIIIYSVKDPILVTFEQMISSLKVPKTCDLISSSSILNMPERRSHNSQSTRENSTQSSGAT